MHFKDINASIFLLYNCVDGAMHIFKVTFISCELTVTSCLSCPSGFVTLAGGAVLLECYKDILGLFWCFYVINVINMFMFEVAAL